MIALILLLLFFSLMGSTANRTMASPLRSPTGQEMASAFAEHSKNKARITTQQIYVVHPPTLPFPQTKKRRKSRMAEE